MPHTLALSRAATLTMLAAALASCQPEPTDRALSQNLGLDPTLQLPPFVPDEVGPTGSLSHKERTLQRLVAGGWDGRLFLSQETELGEVTFTAVLFRPEAVYLGAATQRAVLGDALTDDVPIQGDANDHNTHASFCADPDLDENPFPSNDLGEPDPNGAFETYRIRLITADDDNGFHRLKMGSVRVVVSDPHTEFAEIVLAQMDDDLTPLSDVSGSPLYNYEPSITPDCRLLVWHGRKGNSVTERTGVAMYSYHPHPAASGWSTPRSISDMHWVHGPGASGTLGEAIVDGVPFSERYPVAREPMRDYQGVVIPEGEYVFGPYPWISFDGSEIFFPTIKIVTGPARSGVTAVGARTAWAMQHLDGAINPSRSNLFPTNASHSDALNAAVESAYTAKWQRLFSLPLGLASSMWLSGMRSGIDRLPEVHRPGRYAFIMSHSRRYLEVDLHQHEDGHYLLYLPMNEQIVRDPQRVADALAIQLDEAGWSAAHRAAVRFDPNHTPDVSGFAQHASLSGDAAFPFEHHDAQGAMDSAHAASTGYDVATALDRTDGIVGNAVYFRRASRVTSTLTMESRARLDSADGVTMSLWVKPLTDGDTYRLLSAAGVVLRLTSGLIEARVNGSTVTGAAAPIDEWTHVALTLTPETATLFINGEQVAAQAGFDWFDVGNQVVVGPAGERSFATPLCIIDEVAISDVARTREELLAAALRHVRQGEGPTWDASTAPPLGTPQLPEEFGSPTAAQIELGRDLFFDTRFSADGDRACGTCHAPEHSFTEGAISLGTRNAPPIANRLFTRAQFLDGRAASLEAQALEPFMNESELNLPVADVLAYINDSRDWSTRFDAAYGLFGSMVGPSHLANALASYERSIFSSGSRFDSDHLTPQEQRGRGLFFGRARCAGCHRGPLLSDEAFHAIGFDTSLPKHAGRAAISGRASDLGKFRTLSLRDVARTAPYFHDGSEATLRDVVDFYDEGGDVLDGPRDLAIQALGLSDAEKNALVAFLETLNGAERHHADGSVTYPPRIVGASVGGSSNVWILGLGFLGDGSSVTEVELDGQVYNVPTAAITTDVTPPGWSGSYEKIVITPSALLSADSVVVVTSNGVRSDPFPLTP